MLVKLLFGFAIALFLTYPAAVLTTVIEGQSAAAIYSYHLPTSLFCYLVVSSFLLCHPGARRAIGSFFRGFYQSLRSFQNDRKVLVLLIIILVYALSAFWNLGRADILGDDYDLAYQAYNLQDGILAARKAYVLSFNTHPPLFMTIKHYWFQALFPNGLETVPAWGYRGTEGILGIATIVAVYALTRSLWAPAILAVNNYMVMMGRVYLREMYLTFFLTLSLYFFVKKRYLITAFLVSCGLLVKTSVVVVLPVYLLILLVQKDLKNIFKILTVLGIMYLPVIFYNVAAYVTTGHMDATFSKIFGLAHPFLTGSASPQDNFFNAIAYLNDLYSLPVLLVFAAAAVLFFRNIYFLILVSSALFFVFGGPLREYYLLFMTVPFAILAAKLPKIIVAALIIFSLWYSVSGLSAIRKVYEPVRGWPELAKQVQAVYKPGDCLHNTGGVNDLAMRAYFQTDDAVKAALIGPNYPHDYKMCFEVANPVKQINIFYNQGRVNYQVL